MTITTEVNQTALECYCGISFMVPASLWDFTRRKCNELPHSKTIYCPLGHPITWGAQEKLVRLEKELQTTRANLDAARQRAATAEAKVMKVSRKLDRVKKGTCPECHRHFSNVQRHMKTKHHVT